MFAGSGSALNRLSWLRSSPAFLQIAVTSPRAKFVVFNDGQPLVNVIPDPKKPRRSLNSLAYIPAQSVLPLLGPSPYFAQGKAPGDLLPLELQTTEHNGAGKFLEAARLHGSTIVFLGTHETNEDALLPSSDYKNPTSADDIRGEPYFALDATYTEPLLLQQTFGIANPVNGEKLPETRVEFAEPRIATNTFTINDAAIFSVARSMLDWNTRNKVILSRSRQTTTKPYDSSALHVALGLILCGLAGNCPARPFCHGPITLAGHPAQQQRGYTTTCILVQMSLLSLLC